MLDEAIDLYSADAVRFACADAGDTLEDANFEQETGDSAVTMLYVEEIFMAGGHARSYGRKKGPAALERWRIVLFRR